MGYRPSAERRARLRLERVSESIERDLKKEKSVNKKPVKGFRAEFLERYKLEGYGPAKKAINANFEEEVYDDEILNKWIEEESEK